jgi:hypothetical protein
MENMRRRKLRDVRQSSGLWGLIDVLVGVVSFGIVTVTLICERPIRIADVGKRSIGIEMEMGAVVGRQAKGYRCRLVVISGSTV